VDRNWKRWSSGVFLAASIALRVLCVLIDDMWVLLQRWAVVVADGAPASRFIAELASGTRLPTSLGIDGVGLLVRALPARSLSASAKVVHSAGPENGRPAKTPPSRGAGVGSGAGSSSAAPVAASTKASGSAPKAIGDRRDVRVWTAPAPAASVEYMLSVMRLSRHSPTVLAWLMPVLGRKSLYLRNASWERRHDVAQVRVVVTCRHGMPWIHDS